METTGFKDKQTVRSDGGRFGAPNIAGVKVIELGNILTRSGWMAEIFRTDWPDISIAPQHIIWVEMNPAGVTDWHRHANQTDHLIGVGGNIKVALWDGRADSPTYKQTDVFRIGSRRPVIVVVPPGVWHGLRNESGAPAGYLNVTNQTYDHSDPDNYRLSSKQKDIPIEL
jgi:dTDP-4-dehydrorhamnose 3,5-epimerase